jgi:hypothetical protein
MLGLAAGCRHATRAVSQLRAASSIATADQQLRALPEFAEAEKCVPLGYMLPCTQAGDVVAAKTIAGTRRAAEIVSRLPPNYNIAFTSRAAGLFERCNCVAGGYDLLYSASSREFSPRQVDPSDALETGSHIVEQHLACARVAFMHGSTNKAGDNAAAQAHTSLLSAMRVAHEVGGAALSKPPSTTGLAQAMACVTLKASLARVHGFAAWVAALVGDISNVQAKATTLEAAAPALNDLVTLHSSSALLLTKHITFTADLLAEKNSSSFNADFARGIALVRVASVLIDINAKRNSAAGVLAVGVRFMERSQEHNVFIQSVLSSVCSSMGELSTTIADALNSLRSIKLEDSPPWMLDFAGQCMVELRRQEAANLSVQSELSLLSALWGIWEVQHDPMKRKSNTPLFPLLSADQADIHSIISKVADLAQTSVKKYELLQADEQIAGMDCGIDLTGEITRPLRTISILQFMAEKPVMSEGLLRGTFDYYQRKRLRDSQGLHLHGLQGLDSASWDVRCISYPPALQISIAGHLQVYSSLLSQWDRRERESAAFGAISERIMARSAKAFGLKFQRQPGSPNTRQLLQTMFYSAAFATGHAGSFSCSFPHRMQELTNFIHSHLK